MRVDFDAEDEAVFTEIVALRRSRDLISKTRLAELSEYTRQIDKLQDELMERLARKVYPFPAIEQGEFVFGAEGPEGLEDTRVSDGEQQWNLN